MSRYIPKIAIIILCLTNSSMGLSQTQQYEPSRVIQPSPTAASLGEYGNFQVGYYSGTANIDIPIYNIKTTDHALNITLNYHSTGLRVTENAGWVGLGWSLNAGGVITRTIRGKDDFKNGGYYYEQSLPPSTTNYEVDVNHPDWANHRNYLLSVLDNSKDGEPDIFNYNFNGYSGKFVIGKLNDGAPVFIDDRNNIKIERVFNSDEWILTTADGYKYSFAATESVSNYYYSSNSLDNQIGDNAPIQTGSLWNWDLEPTQTTAWYLTSIESPKGELITLTYEMRSTSMSLTQKSESIYNLTFPEVICSSGFPFSAKYETFNASRQIIYDVYLTKISFKNGFIDFITSDRDDIDYTGNDKPQKLSEIAIKNSNGEVKRKFTFSYSYFSGQRLKLDNIVESGSDGTSKPPYTFTYFNPNSLPAKYSKSVDHWGYYNNESNNTLLPEVTLESPQIITFDGGIRSPSAEVSYLKNGMLSSITYPTGGKTDFDYELNEYGNPTGDDSYQTVPKSVVSLSRIEDPYTESSKTFTINVTTKVEFMYNYIRSDENANSIDGVETEYAFVHKQGQVPPIASFSNWSCPGQPNPLCGSDNSAYEIYSMTLTPGTYTISVNYIYGYMTTIIASWKEKVPVSTRKGGGLRIKSIINYENGNKTKHRSFLYTGNNGTSGILLTQPKYSYDLSVQFSNESNTCLDLIHYLGRSSSSVYTPSLTAKGVIVGYDKVTELIGENGEGGKVEYYYYNGQDYENPFPFIPPHNNPLCSKLAVLAEFNAAGDILRKVEYFYDNKNTTALKGVKLYQPRAVSNKPLDAFSVKFYDSFSHWVVLKQEKETLYNSNGNIVTVSDYYYDNDEHLQQTRKNVSTSIGGTESIISLYPSDYAPGTSFIDNMKAKHLTGYPIETVRYKNIDGTGTILSGNITKYKAEGNGLIDQVLNLETRTPVSLSNFKFANRNAGELPPASAASVFNPDSRYKAALTYNEYDVKGNPLQYTSLKDGYPTSYLWEYNNQHPVAEATNASYSDIAYASFEADGKGNWTYAGTPFIEPLAPTGKKVYNLSSGSITKSINSSTTYIISYWRPTGSSALSIAGTVSGYPVSGRTVNGWKYYEHKISAQSTATISGSGNIDELRLYPAGALMTTYTYDPLIGMTSQCDVNNRITYYEYDDFGRLMLVRDQDKNILKRICYNYAGQVQDCNATYAPVAPPSPGNLTAVINAGSAVELNWVNNAVNATVNEVYRSAGDATHYTLLVTLPDNVSTYTDTQTDINTLYFYKIKAAGSGGSSAYSNEESITTPAVSPSPLSNTAPALNGIADIYVRSGSSKTAGIAATDDAGDILGFVVSGLPAFASFSENGNGTGAFHLSPVNTAPGSFSVTVKVIDNYGAYSQKVINIIVVDKDIATYHINFNNIDYPVADPLWNSFNSTKTGGVQVLANTILYALKDETGTASAISVKLLNSWPQNYLGAVTGDDSGVYPDAVIATGYYFYVQASAPAKTIKIAGLKADKKYDLTFYGNRTYGSDQVTNYTVGAQTVTLNARNNTSNTVQITGLAANSQGEIDIVVDAAMTKYATINAMVIKEYPNN